MKPRRFLDGRVTLRGGDCLKVLAQLPDNCVDAVLTDPPYHIESISRRYGKEGSIPSKRGQTGVFHRTSSSFLGASWDDGDLAFRAATWKAIYRVLKPGGYLLSFGFARTFGRLSVAIESAGFVTHPLIVWLYAQGMPKPSIVRAPGYEDVRYGAGAIKPAAEPIYMGQKPFSETSGTANIQLWGTGGLNIEACRIPGDTTPGRWPANVIHDGSPEVMAMLPEGGTFFYCAKAGPDDRLGFDHPTIKPLRLKQYLVRLAAPAGGLILDPFAGTGTTGEAAFREGCRALLIERERKYLDNIAYRMELAANPAKRAAVVAAAGAQLHGAEGTPLFETPAEAAE